MKNAWEKALCAVAIALIAAPSFGQSNDRWRQEQARQQQQQQQQRRGEQAAEQARQAQLAAERAREQANRARGIDGSARTRPANEINSGRSANGGGGSRVFPSKPPIDRLVFRSPQQGAAQALDRRLAPGTRVSSGGVSVPIAKPTPAQEKKGFTGRFTEDGRALVKFQGRIFLVPASRIGVRPPSRLAANENQSPTRFTQQQLAAVNSNMQRLAGVDRSSGGGGEGGGRGTRGNAELGGTGNGKDGLTPLFNSAARDRIADASGKRLLPEETRYADLRKSMHEAYKNELRAEMQRPAVSDARLAYLISKLHKDDATVGSGSTAAAVREERATGQPVKGSWHRQKAEDGITSLTNWLAQNPNAAPGDRAAAENMIKDMQNALSGR